MDLIKSVVDTLTSIKKLDEFKDWFDDKRYAKRADSRAIARRVLQVFDAHDITVADIPLVFSEFSFEISDFGRLDALVDKLTPEFLAALSEHFFINLEWLKTGTGHIQQAFELGYDFEAIYKRIVNFNSSEQDNLIAYFIATDGIKFVPAADHGGDEAVAIVIQIIHGEDDSSEVTYSRYLPLYIGYWHYYKTRMMLKSISLLLFQDKKVIPQKGVFYKHLNHESFHRDFAATVLNSRQWNWHPDDYIFCNGESAQEKDPIDAERMQEYLKEIGFYAKITDMRSTKFLN